MLLLLVVIVGVVSALFLRLAWRRRLTRSTRGSVKVVAPPISLTSGELSGMGDGCAMTGCCLRLAAWLLGAAVALLLPPPPLLVAGWSLTCQMLSSSNSLRLRRPRRQSGVKHAQHVQQKHVKLMKYTSLPVFPILPARTVTPFVPARGVRKGRVAASSTICRGRGPGRNYRQPTVRCPRGCGLCNLFSRRGLGNRSTGLLQVRRKSPGWWGRCDHRISRVTSSLEHGGCRHAVVTRGVGVCGGNGWSGRVGTVRGHRQGWGARVVKGFH